MTEKTRDRSEYSVRERLLHYWSHPDHGPLGETKTATQASVDQFESRHGIRFPEDFRDFLVHVGGFDQDGHYQDARGFNFWPLAKLVRVPEYGGHEHRFAGDHSYFLFCDYLDFSWGYAIRLDGGKNDVIMVGTSDGRPKRVASSFTDFIDDYLRDDSALYP